MPFEGVGVFRDSGSPVTVPAGIYGVNFHHFPELEIPLPYPALWRVFFRVDGFLVFLFRRSKWL